jgi:hypothetical protein
VMSNLVHTTENLQLWPDPSWRSSQQGHEPARSGLMNVVSVPEVRMVDTEVMKIPAYVCMGMIEDDSDERCLLNYGSTGGAYLLLHLQTLRRTWVMRMTTKRCMKEPFFFT